MRIPTNHGAVMKKAILVLFSLMVALSSILAPVLSDQEPYGPDDDVFNALPRVMAPGPDGSADGPSVESTLVAYASALPGGSSSICTPWKPWD